MTTIPTTTNTTNERRMIDLLDRRDLREMAQADQLIMALGEAFPPAKERRAEPRLRYQVRARLELVDENGEPVDRPATLHTRDVTSGATGFVTTQDLGAADHAVLHLPCPEGGETKRVACRVRRTREAGNGWFEGTVEFEDRQAVFSTKAIGR